MNTENTQEETIKMTVGQQLRHAREQLGLGVKDIADQLCLKLEIIKDIEDDKNFDDLAPTFVRGYIRSYARIVRLPDDELLPLYSNDPNKLKFDLKGTPVRGFTLIKSHRRRERWFIAATFIFGIIGIGVVAATWWQNHTIEKQRLKALQVESVAKTNHDSKAVSLEMAIGSPSNKITAPDGIAEPSQQAKTNTATMLSENNANLLVASTLMQKRVAILPNQKAQLNTDSAKQQDVIDNMLHLKFRDDSWVTVTDAAGVRLFSALKKKGETLSLSGKPPYRVRLGVASAVEVTYQKKLIAMTGQKGSITITVP